MMYAQAKVRGGKKFNAAHPLMEEARQMHKAATLDTFISRVEGGNVKDNPFAALPGARRQPAKYVPGVTPHNG